MVKNIFLLELEQKEFFLAFQKQNGPMSISRTTHFQLKNLG